MTGGDAAALDGLKILVVEDLLLVADVISEGLADSGCDVVGPVARLEAGLALARQAPLDGAVLDVNLAGDSSVPIAEVLHDRGIPYLFVTGYDAETALPPEYRGAPRLTKPFRIASLVQLAARCFGHCDCAAGSWDRSA
ncbi:MAG TPA: response regulator [Stellaceae bacterium]|nr:response regulator [Stellaceae bacterium]